ncbi:hypothetical protein Acsp06_51710 [Actinomycetospora sp. NBRC 106375]|nr:hypothetical protein Acsp06_51710 [Actinomycetospora sp. NBRC 106375]
MAQEDPAPAGEDRRRLQGLGRERPVVQRVHAAVHRLPPAGPHLCLDAALGEATAVELFDRHDVVLLTTERLPCVQVEVVHAWFDAAGPSTDPCPWAREQLAPS